jgi:hypothetical protein
VTLLEIVVYIKTWALVISFYEAYKFGIVSYVDGKGEE